MEMSQTPIAVRGTLTPDGKVELIEKPALPPGPVRVTLEALPEPPDASRGSVWDTLERIWAEREARGIKPRSRAEVDAEINAMRDESEERMRKIERLQGQTARTRREPEC